MSKRYKLTIISFILAITAYVCSYLVRTISDNEVKILQMLVLAASTYVAGESYRKSVK